MIHLEVIVLAGGMGTRLRQVVTDRPKPMAEVAGRPFLEWLLLMLRGQQVRRVVLAIGYKGKAIQAHFGDGAAWGMEISYSHEQTPLGTGGCLRLASSQLEGERFVVLNGDSYCPVDLGLLQRTHVLNAADATLWLVEVPDCSRYGAVEVDASNRVVSFHEKGDRAGSGLINAGIYLFERRVMERIPGRGAVSLETAVFPDLLGGGLSAVVGNGPFLDIGTPEDYLRATQYLEREFESIETQSRSVR